MDTEECRHSLASRLLFYAYRIDVFSIGFVIDFYGEFICLNDCYLSQIAKEISRLTSTWCFFMFLPDEQWKRPLISDCLGYIGDCTTELIIGTLINHEIRIPIKQPGFPMESQSVLFSWLRCVGRFNMGRLKGPTAGTLVGDPLSRGSSWAFLDFPRFFLHLHSWIHGPCSSRSSRSSRRRVGNYLFCKFSPSWKTLDQTFLIGRNWCSLFFTGKVPGQIIATSHDLGPQNVADSEEGIFFPRTSRLVKYCIIWPEILKKP